MEMLDDLPAERARSAWQQPGTAPTPAPPLPIRLASLLGLASARLGWAAPAAALVALAARLPYFIHSDFPLNDGGLFVAMSRDLWANHFRLPAFTSYNADAIPFAYPPLAFYGMAILHGLSGADMLAIARWLPLLINLASVLAVVALARAVLQPFWAAALAPIVFALLPRSYEWMIMGGGLTRSLGYVLAIACVLQAVRLARAPSVWRTAVCALLAGLALASHLEEGLFALYSAALALVCYRRHPSGVLASAAIGVGAVLVSAPWWLTVVLQHGPAPFLAASLTSGWSTLGEMLAGFGDFLAPPSLPLSVVGSLGVLGAAMCLARGELFLPLWLPAIFVLTPRSAPSEGVLPLALLASLVLTTLVLPALASTTCSNPSLVGLATALRSGLSRQRWVRAAPVRLVAASLALLVLLGGVYRVWPRLSVDPHALDSLTPGERQAMDWVASNTAPDARFLVLASTWSWEEDMNGEWFPVLADRQSVLTPQGAEWLPNEMHARRVCLFEKIRDISPWDHPLADLDTWASDRNISYSGIYISKALRGTMDWSPLIAEAAASNNYTVVLDTPEAAVLQRREPVASRWSESGPLDVARDCQSLADQAPETIASFEGHYGPRAAIAWAAEHEQSLPQRASVTGLLARMAASLRGSPGV